jgi:hypothetical protein
MKRLLILLALLLSATLALALPTQQEVEAAVRASRYSEAEAMMREVVAAKPESAKARYVLAELLAHNRQFDAAAVQLREARRIDPSTKYAEAARVDAFEKQLAQLRSKATGSLVDKGAVIGAPPATTGSTGAAAQAMNDAPAVSSRAAPDRAQSTPREASSDDSGMPSWLIIGGLVVVGVLVMRAFRRKRQAQQVQQVQPFSPGQQAGWGGANPQGYGPGAGAPYGPGAYPAQQAGGGALRTGMAVAGGLAAGVLLDRMLTGNQAQAADHQPGQALGNNSGDTGQALDDTGFERRPIDFGNGAGWGGGNDAPSDGGGGDAGGDGGGDGGGW